MNNRQKIDHDLEDFQEGEEYIMTFEDKPMLNVNGDINEEDEDYEDVLVNVEKKEKEKAEHNSYLR